MRRYFGRANLDIEELMPHCAGLELSQQEIVSTHIAHIVQPQGTIVQIHHFPIILEHL